MASQLNICVSTALPDVPGVTYGALARRLEDECWYVHVRLDSATSSRWFIAELTTDGDRAASPDQLLSALHAAYGGVHIQG